MSITYFEEPETLTTVSSENESETVATTDVPLAVHAIMLEYGFVCSEAELGKKIDSICYTLPKVLEHGSREKVTLRFQRFDNLYIIYGSLVQKGDDIYRLCIDKKTFSGVEVSKFRKEVTDCIVYPLSIDLCERVGVHHPPSFMSMPIEIKLKILDLINGTDLAKVACVCSELQNISSDNDSSLWKDKFLKKFGGFRAPEVAQGSWQRAFAKHWEDLMQEFFDNSLTNWRFDSSYIGYSDFFMFTYDF